MFSNEFDINKLAVWLIPHRLRQTRLMALVRVLLAPLVQSYSWYVAWKNKSDYDLKYQTGQVAHLEYVLNDIFDSVLKRIYIAPTPSAEFVWLFTDAETLPVYLYTDAEGMPAYVYTEAEAGAAVYDFIIHLPLGIVLDEVRFRATADRYKRDGKSYIIVYE